MLYDDQLAEIGHAKKRESVSLVKSVYGVAISRRLKTALCLRGVPAFFASPVRDHLAAGKFWELCGSMFDYRSFLLFCGVDLESILVRYRSEIDCAHFCAELGEIRDGLALLTAVRARLCQLYGDELGTTITSVWQRVRHSPYDLAALRNVLSGGYGGFGGLYSALLSLNASVH
jgi:hypothetical protein